MKYLVLSLLGAAVVIGGSMYLGLRNLAVAPRVPGAPTGTPPFVSASPEIQFGPTAASSAVGAIVSQSASTAVSKVRFLNPLLFQGDTLVAEVAKEGAAPASVSFDARPLSFFEYGGSYRIVGAIRADETEGYHDFSVKFADGKAFDKKLYVRARKFPFVDLGVPEKLGLTPTQLAQNLEAEQSNLTSIVGVKTGNIFFSRGFGLALAKNDKIIGPYGEIRKTGNQTTRHLGIDFGSPKGSAVAAMNDGVVREAENDPLYGNTIIVDHGQGIFSLYMHLDSILAKVGQMVKYGQVIGTVGESGYATGPHLHLSVKINTISVDPVKFVNILK